MAAKMFAFFALLALSTCAASAYISPVSALAATASPLYWPQATSIAATHPCVQLQVLASSILATSTLLIQQPLAILQQQCQAHLALQSIMTLQQQQLLVNSIANMLPNVFNQLALANPIAAAYWQQQQFLPNVFNQLALANPIAAAYWQQQQFLPNVFNQLALTSPFAQLQQQQLVSSVNQVAWANPISGAYWQQQQLLPNVFNQLALVSPVAHWQQQQLVSSVFNPVALANPYLQQPFIGGAIF